MIGTKIYKNNFNEQLYQEAATYCNQSQLAIIQENNDYYEVVQISAPTEEEILNNLRRRRETECFKIINRGQFWYDRLSNEEKIELSNWYQKWLDVTITKEIHIKPIWLH